MPTLKASVKCAGQVNCTAVSTNTIAYTRVTKKKISRDTNIRTSVQYNCLERRRLAVVLYYLYGDEHSDPKTR